MSNLDKTGKKLIDSLRKTKKGPATAAVKSATQKTTTRKAAEPKKSPATLKPKPAATKAKPAKINATKAKPSNVKTTTKASPKVSTRTSSSAASRKKQLRKKTTPISDIPFQDGSQVWPD